MVYLEEQLSAHDGTKLHVYRWKPEQAKAALVISHGWSEHAGRYADLAQWFCSQGYEVHALDHRGHGQSEGKRGHVSGWSDYTRDLETLRETIDQQYQYILGHSMGGMIATLHMLDYPDRFVAAALSGPAADLSIDVPAVKRLLGQVFSAWFPKLIMKNKFDPNVVCGNPDIVESYISDPLNHGQVSVRWFNDYLKQIKRVKAEVHALTTPVAIWHGAEDELVAPWVGKQLFDAMESNEKHYETIEGALHEILFERDWESLADQMRIWLERH